MNVRASGFCGVSVAGTDESSIIESVSDLSIDSQGLPVPKLANELLD